MMKRQLLLTLILASLLTQPVHGLQNKILEQSNDNGEDILIQDHHPSDGARISAYGTTFNLSETAWITNITLWLHQTTNPTCYMNVRLYNHNNGTYGVDGIPETPSIANSSILIAPIAGAYTPYTFNFSDDDRIQLDGNQIYVFALVAWNGTLNDANRIEVDGLRAGAGPAAGTYDGNGVNYTNGAWLPMPNTNPCFIMRGDVLWSGTADLIDDAFSYFGILNYMANATAYVTGIAAHFSSSISNMITLINQQFRIISNVFTWVMRWVTRFTDMILTLTGYVTGIFDGTAGVVTYLGNWWTFIDLASWYPLVTLICVLLWVDSIVKRGRTQGEVQVAIRDLQTITSILSYFASMFTLVINTVVDTTFRLFDAIT